MSDDLYRQLEDRLVQLIQEFNAYRNVNPLENASIRKGRVRFVGGLLRVDSGGRVEIVGTLEIDGETTVTGQFTVTGPWELTGNGTITGDVTSTGTLTQNGPWNLNGVGKITGDTDLTGNMKVNAGGKITVQGGGGDVVMDSSYGEPRVLLGSVNITGGTSALTMQTGTAVMYLMDSTIRIPAMATKPLSEVPGGYVGGVFVDLTGKFFRITV